VDSPNDSTTPENPVLFEEFIVHRYDSWGEFTADVDTWELV
jgi:hypothetical protein